jgi:predicted GNAT family acetyltransferase
MEDIKMDNNKFYIGEDSENPIAEITFIPLGEDKIIVNHTYVSPKLRGLGIGERLVEKAAEYAREGNKKIVPTCSFVKKLMTENEKYKDLIAD